MCLRSTGGNKLLNSSLAQHLSDPSLPQQTLSRLLSLGFSHVPDPSALATSDPTQIRPFELSREKYAALYGPTKGDRVRLGDTELWIEVEEDRTVHGDELKFGGGQSPFSRSPSNPIRAEPQTRQCEA